MQTLTVEIADWSRSQVAELNDVPFDITVEELLEDAQEAMSLPGDTYHLLREGEKLARGSTLAEAGVESGDELTIAPEVSAGSR
jgi:hypothetical protein